ncbi:hypothetical protein GCM10010269_56920 [Streptomyces humidus]|uniref:Transposase n=1 Tax=Streptomyces humidus TaxID=52259 RepID=A0A918G033_9ACTN|nr:hypothetical protein GCM10010269_56920 [Streptomyces humidus]
MVLSGSWTPCSTGPVGRAGSQGGLQTMRSARPSGNRPGPDTSTRGLDHFEGRSWVGWHHHVTLVTAAHAFLTEQRLAPSRYTGLTLYQILDTIQNLVNCWTGTCPTCHQPPPGTSTTSQNPSARQT